MSTCHCRVTKVTRTHTQPHSPWLYKPVVPIFYGATSSWVKPTWLSIKLGKDATTPSVPCWIYLLDPDLFDLICFSCTDGASAMRSTSLYAGLDGKPDGTSLHAVFTRDDTKQTETSQPALLAAPEESGPEICSQKIWSVDNTVVGSC